MTERKRGYSTRQRGAVLAFLQNHPGECFSAQQIHASLGGLVGQTTVYRALELLEKQGEVLRFTTGEDTAVYRLVEGACHKHMHLKCLSCGEIIHMDCGFIGELSAHLSTEHAFALDPMHTVIYGRCAKCEKEAG